MLLLLHREEHHQAVDDRDPREADRERHQRVVLLEEEPGEVAAVEGGNEGLGDREERQADHRDDEGEEARDEHLHHAALLEAQDVQICQRPVQACSRQKR